MTTAIVRFTTKPFTVSNLDTLKGGLAAPRNDTVDVLGFRAIRLSLKVYGFTGPAPGELIVAMETGMNLDDPKGFTSLGIFDPVGDAPSTVQRVFTDLQRYARWKVVHFRYQGQPEEDPVAATAVFEIEGVLYT